MIVIVTGVTGTGKTTIGKKLAADRGWIFADADDYHSDANKKKMHDGVALTDEDRAPWLAKLHDLVRGWKAASQNAVLACSALKAVYRTTLGAGLAANDLRYVYLYGDPQLLASRLNARKGSFMNPELLASQLATMEVPDEAISVDVAASPDAIVATIEARI